MSTSTVLLVARRDYFAYIGAWGFWLSLITAPFIVAVLLFAPVLLARAEPPRVLAVLAEQQGDADLVVQSFRDQARRDARREIEAYVAAAAPMAAQDALAAFDAEADRAAAIRAAREMVQARAPNAMRAFPQPSPRYSIADAPADSIEALRPYLDGQRALPDGRSLYGALNLRRDEAGAPRIEYWSTNLSHDEPSNIARSALRLAMQREALAAQGLAASEADRIDAFDPAIAQFDPRPSGGEGRSRCANERRSMRLWRSRSFCGASCFRSRTCCFRA